jgi:Icc-related predicted phosphoesterase
VYAIADLHGSLVPVPECDLLLIAGDICPTLKFSARGQAAFLDDPFRRWLERIPARHVVAVAGNHDFIFQHEPERVPAGLRWTYLQDSSTHVGGLKIYGSPWQPWFHDWAFNLREPELEAKWERIPDDTDVLLLHGPPHGYGDRTSGGRHEGSPSLLRAIRRVRPRLAVFGHIHEARGRWDLEVDGKAVTLANVSVMNERYEPVHPAVRFDLEDRAPGDSP